MQRFGSLFKTLTSFSFGDLPSITDAINKLTKGAPRGALNQLIAARKLVRVQDAIASSSLSFYDVLDEMLTIAPNATRGRSEKPIIHHRDRGSISPDDCSFHHSFTEGERQVWLEVLSKIVPSEVLSSTDKVVSSDQFISGTNGAEVLVNYYHNTNHEEQVLQIGEVDAAYVVVLESDRYSTGVWYSHASLSMYEEGVIRQTNSTYTSISMLQDAQTIRSSTYGLLTGLCDAAYTNGTIPLTTVDSLLDEYGSSQAVALVRSVRNSVASGDTVSVLVMVSTVLENISGEVDEGSEFITPKDNPGFVTNMAGTVLAALGATLAIILSVLFKGIAVVITMITSVISALLPYVFDKIDHTNFDVVGYSELPTFNVVGPVTDPFSLGSGLIADQLRDVLNTSGVAYLPITDPEYLGTSQMQYSDCTPAGILLYKVGNSDGSTDVLVVAQICLTAIADDWTAQGPLRNSGWRAVPGKGPTQAVDTWTLGNLAIWDGPDYAIDYDVAPRYLSASDGDLRRGLISSVLTMGRSLFRSSSFDNLSEWQLNEVDRSDVHVEEVSSTLHIAIGLVDRWVTANSSLIDAALADVDLEWSADMQRALVLSIMAQMAQRASYTPAASSDVGDVLDLFSNNKDWWQATTVSVIRYMNYMSNKVDLSWLSDGQKDFMFNLAKPGRPAYNSVVNVPTLSKAALISGAIIGIAAAGAIAGGVLVGRKALRQKAVARLAQREAEFEDAKAAMATSPTSANKKQFAKANTRLTRAWKMAGWVGVPMYNGFSTGSEETAFPTAEDASAATQQNGDERISRADVDEILLLIRGSIS